MSAALGDLATLSASPAADPAVSPSDDLCHLCGSDDADYLFVSHGVPVRRCTGCGLIALLLRAAQRANVRFRRAHGRDPSVDYQPLSDPGSDLAASERYADMLSTQCQPGASVIVVSAAGHPIGKVVAKRGFSVGVQTFRQLESEPASKQVYDAALIVYQLEKSSRPIAMLEQLRSRLRPDGALMIVTPSLDSWPARMLSEQWTEWRADNLYYFNNETLQKMLLRAGFEQVRVYQDRRPFSLDHIHERARSFPRTGLTQLINVGVPCLPRMVRRSLRLEIPTSGVVVSARCAETRQRPTLSVVMPVFNERASFERTVEQVLAKEIPGIDKELIIVESNSTDGTREVVERYQGRPGITVVLQDRPRGKGHAVREALRRASGDIILVQDADDEYDVRDYDALVRPLLQHRRAFVLGSRHHGDWQIRRFDGAGGAGILNIGHVVFMLLLNVLYFQRLRDPFTMYKVFRRDCVTDIAFECDRFDFDFELVIKLLRKGYRPLEIPVSYNARSYAEGKKVALFRDPITWIRALLRYRLGSIYVDGRK